MKSTFIELVNHLDQYDAMKSEIAEQLFKNSIYHNIVSESDMIIIAGKHQNANAFSYIKRYVRGGDIYSCIICQNVDETAWTGIHPQCMKTLGRLKYKYINHTGIPNGNKVNSHFYIHNSFLLIIQHPNNVPIVSKLCLQTNLNNWIPLKWARYSMCILLLSEFDLLHELQQYIMRCF